MEQTREELLDNVAQRIYDIMANGRESEAKNLIYSDDMIASQSNANFNLNELKSVLEKKVGYLSHQNVKNYIKNYLLPDNNYKNVDFHEKKTYNMNNTEVDYFNTSNQNTYNKPMQSYDYSNKIGQNQPEQRTQSYNTQGLSNDQIYRIFKGYDISNIGHVTISDVYFVILEAHQTNPNTYRSPSTQEVQQVISRLYPGKQQFNIQQISNILSKFTKF